MPPPRALSSFVSQVSIIPERRSDSHHTRKTLRLTSPAANEANLILSSQPSLIRTVSSAISVRERKVVLDARLDARLDGGLRQWVTCLNTSTMAHTASGPQV